MKTYSSKANANRAAKGIAKKIPETDFTLSEPYEINGEGWTFDITSKKAKVEIDPEILELIEQFNILYPHPPKSGETTVRKASIKPFKDWEMSEVEGPVSVAWGIYEEFYREGRVDERKTMIERAVDAGVHYNTAATQYRKFREAKGLSGAVRKKVKSSSK